MSGEDAFTLTLPWRDPLEVAAGLAHREGGLCLLSDGSAHGRLSWVGADPDLIRTEPIATGQPFEALQAAGMHQGLVGLIAYDAGARPATGDRMPAAGNWPDLILARYPALLRFDHQTRRVHAIGIGQDAERQAGRAAEWLDGAQPVGASPPPSEDFAEEGAAADYRRSVADVVARIGLGELFQANVARGWTGRLRQGADPFDVFARLANGPAPYGAFWRIGGRALVSNSPELFLLFDPISGRMETRPIKGTRPRRPDPKADAALATELAESAKDRAENLMIVDLMRNDLARVSEPGSVSVERLFAVESFETVHHLVSTVTGRARAGVRAAEVLEATFPPGSITGAPKHQAMKVIADHEPPRGPWCGSLFLLDERGRMTASVLIRTASFWREAGGWRWRTLAGAGITADSDPDAELAETEAKISAMRNALIGRP